MAVGTALELEGEHGRVKVSGLPTERRELTGRKVSKELDART